MDTFNMEENMQFGDVWQLGLSSDETPLYDDIRLSGPYHGGLFDDCFASKPDITDSDYWSTQNVDAGLLDQSWMEIKQLLEDPETETIALDEPFSQLAMPCLPTVKKEEKDDCAKYKNTVLYGMLKKQSKLDGTLSNLHSQQLTEVTDIKFEVLTPPPSSPEQVIPSPEQVIPVIHIPEAEGSEPIFDQFNLEGAFLQSPLSSDDIESILSSPALSPLAPSQTTDNSFSTIDVSSLLAEDETISIAINPTDLYEVVPIEKPKQIRGCPYKRPQKNKSKGRKQTASISPNPTDLELEFMSKKDRKKLQNKNAAIRYRMKKKDEADVKKSEEEVLEDQNKVLQGKVDDLTRQITYMKDLINEVRKARGQNPI